MLVTAKGLLALYARKKRLSRPENVMKRTALGTGRRVKPKFSSRMPVAPRALRCLFGTPFL
jgi:hypothetical protein